MSGREWILSATQQAAHTAAAGISSLAGEAFFRKEGGRRPSGPTDSHAGEPREHHIKSGRAAEGALAAAALPSFQECGRERGWRRDAGFRGAELHSGEQT